MFDTQRNKNTQTHKHTWIRRRYLQTSLLKFKHRSFTAGKCIYSYTSKTEKCVSESCLGMHMRTHKCFESLPSWNSLITKSFFAFIGELYSKLGPVDALHQRHQAWENGLCGAQGGLSLVFLVGSVVPGVCVWEEEQMGANKPSLVTLH